MLNADIPVAGGMLEECWKEALKGLIAINMGKNKAKTFSLLHQPVRANTERGGMCW